MFSFFCPTPPPHICAQRCTWMMRCGGQGRPGWQVAFKQPPPHLLDCAFAEKWAWMIMIMMMCMCMCMCREAGLDDEMAEAEDSEDGPQGGLRRNLGAGSSDSGSEQEEGSDDDGEDDDEKDAEMGSQRRAAAGGRQGIASAAQRLSFPTLSWPACWRLLVLIT
eukprot:1159374-Pelagomonas_calceolata.AAC.7